jgi:acyl-coenzyme A thioesterase PaaI-like protein
MTQPPALETLGHLIELIPYAKWIGMKVDVQTQAPLFHLPFQASHIGNVLVPALHGGLVGGFLENAAILYLMWACQTTSLPRIVDFSIDYLRSGKPQDVWAQCDIVRQGKRIANVEIRGWQEEYTKPIVAARAHFLLA